MLAFDFDFPFYYPVFCILIGIAYAYLLYTREKSPISSRLEFFLFFLRAIFISIIAALLLNIVFKFLHEKVHKPIVILAQDVSESIPDTSSFNFLTDLSNQLTDFEVHEFSFSDDVIQGFSNKNNGVLTNFSNLITDLNSRFSNRHVAALVLSSDGLYNRGGNPLYTQIKYPVYTIAQGDTSLQRDVSIVKIRKNDIAFLGNTFPLEITINAQHCNGNNIELSIWNENKRLYAENIQITSNNHYKKANVYLSADQVGLQYFTVKVTQLAGEQNIDNNTYTAYIDVIDSQYKILLLSDQVHPDISAYKSAVEKNKNYEVQQMTTANFKGDIEPYHLIVLFGIKKGSATIESLKNSTTPLLIFNLQQNTHKEFISSLDFNSKGLEEVEAIKNKSFSDFTFSPNLLNLIETAPPLFAPFGQYTLRLGVKVVLSQRINGHVTSNPIILIDEESERKIAVVTTEGFWRWRIHDYLINKNNDVFEELFSKLTQNLVLQEDKSRFRLNYEEQVDENMNILFEASVYNKNYELFNDKDIELIIINEDGDQFNYEFSKYSKMYTLNAGMMPEGRYSFLAKVKGTELIEKGSFDVKALQLEKLITVANHKLLYQLANNNGGKLFYRYQLDEIAKTIIKSKDNYKSISVSESLLGVINMPWLLLCLLILISIEWFVRKYNGLI